MRSMTVLVGLAALLLSSGCEMTQAQKGAGIGALSGVALGALFGGKKEAAIAGGVGALAGGLFGKNQEAAALRKENTLLRQSIEQREMLEENRTLRKENIRLRSGKTKAMPSGYL